MKIPNEVTRQNITDQIKELKRTHDEYITGTHSIAACGLCKVSVNYGYFGLRCGTCLWVWFTGDTCIDYYLKRNLRIAYLSSNNPKGKSTRSNRKKQIKRWIKKLEEYNDRHK